MDREQTARTTSRPEVSTADILEQRLRIANTISAISARLARTGDLNARFDDSLAEVGTLVGADRAYVFQFKESGALMDNTHEWCAEGVAPQITELQGLQSETFDWFVVKVRQGEAFQISDVSALPPEAESERSTLEAQGIRSLLIMPMGPVGRPTGFVGFDNLHEAGGWRPEDIELLRIASQLMGDALERQHSYQTLELSVQRQKAILENIPDIAWLKDEDSRFVHVNEAFACSCGVPADELIGKTDLDIWPQVLAVRYRDDDAEVMRTRRRKRFEEPLADKDLGERVIETIKTPVFDSNGSVIGTTGIARDVTERTEAEHKIRESEDQYRRLVESLPAILYRYSNRKGGSYWSPQVEDILGFSPRDLFEKPFLWHDAIHPDDLPTVDKAIAAFEVGDRFDLNYRIRDADGIWHWFHDRSIRRLDVEGEVVIEGLAFDITAQERAEQALRESEQRYRGVVEDTPLLICRFLPGGEITFVNEAYCRYFEKTAEELVGSIFLTWIPEKDREIVVRNIHSLTVDSPTQSHDHRVFTPEGTTRWQRWTNRALFDTEGNVVAFQAIGDDITERKQAEELIEYQATFDVLTDLPNRRLLLDRLAQALARCRRHGHTGALLFIDLDQFKQVNDSLGHPVGDALLQEVSTRLKQKLREEDTSARLGGDEFVVLFPEVSDNPEEAAQEAQAGAERIQTELSAPYVVHNQELHITASIGIAMFPMEDESADDIVKYADTAMYRAKEAGRNTIRFFLPSMQLAAEERLKLQNDLRRAISNEELRLHFQPQVDVSGNMIGAEALLRWQHPQRGLVAPNAFIPVAEETGQILAIGEWVLESAIGQLKAWRNEIAESAFHNLSINVSPRQFRQTDFVLRIERVLGETGVDPNLLTLELTEGMLVENLDDTIGKMRALKRLGLRFSIDDFGTGYSSLAYLRSLPLDEIKIDRSFVQDITTDPSDAGLVDTIITMAEHLGLEVVAEGVETQEQLDFLRAKGCELFQGYYFCRPQSVEDFEELLSKRVTYTKGSTG